MGVRLPDHDQGPFRLGGGPLLYPVVTCDVPGIGPREVWRLDAAQFPVALVEYPVAVAALYHLAPKCLERAVTVPEVRVALSQILVGQFEIEIVTDTLKNECVFILYHNIYGGTIGENHSSV